MKPVVPRSLAHLDLDDALTHYQKQDSMDAALGLLDAVEAAFDHLSRLPGSGSPRSGLALNVPDLRSWPLAGHPFLIFYIETDTHIDVWRVLHAERNIPESMR